MPIYTVLKTFRYTETVEVEADTFSEARNLAMGVDGERNNDDWCFDCEVISVDKDNQ